MKNNTNDFYLCLAFCPFIKIDEASEIIKNCSLKSGEASFNSLNLYCSSKSFVSKFNFWRLKFNLNYYKERLAKENISLIFRGDTSYPAILEEIYKPPPFLFYKGDINILNDTYDFSLAVVGSRLNSPAASKTITNIIEPLCFLKKVLVLSGLAYGVDTLAHKCALLTKSKTVAVLGSGLFKENIYPKENFNLAHEIVNSGGLLLSEFAPQIGPNKENFPRRNRIVSALAKATIIIEAQERSGALITARLACEQNKDVFAIPGSIFSKNYKGNNRLIQAGAYPLLSYTDILKYYS